MIANKNDILLAFAHNIWYLTIALSAIYSVPIMEYCDFIKNIEKHLTYL